MKNVILGVFIVSGFFNPYKASAMEAEEEKRRISVSPSRTGYVNPFDVMEQFLLAVNTSFQKVKEEGAESSQSDLKILESYLQRQLQREEGKEDREFLQSMLEELGGMPEELD